MTHVSALPVRRGLGFVVFAGVAWGTGGATGALLQRGGALSPIAVAFWRLAIAALIVGVASRQIRHLRQVRQARQPRAIWKGWVVGPLMAINQGAYFAAIAHSGVAFATMVTMGVMPVLATLAARVFLGERLRRHALMGIGLAVVGVVLMADLANAASLVGAGFAMLSAAAYSGMTVLAKASSSRASSAQGTSARAAAQASAAAGSGVDSASGPVQGSAAGGLAWRFGAGALCLLPVAVVMAALASGSATAAGGASAGGGATAAVGVAAAGGAMGSMGSMGSMGLMEALAPLIPSVSALPALAYLGAVPTALAYGLFFAGLGSVRVATAAVIALLEPVVGAIIGVTLLGERLTGGQMAGGALLLTAVVVTALADLTPSRVIANTREP